MPPYRHLIIGGVPYALLPFFLDVFCLLFLPCQLSVRTTPVGATLPHRASAYAVRFRTLVGPQTTTSEGLALIVGTV